jgi:ATP-dependent DNA helicase RecQ
MIELCYADRCRQQIILEYFGEEDAAPCGSCDACRRGGSRHAERIGAAEEIEMLRKALSGVARMCHRGSEGEWIPRFGKGRIVAMLLGSKSREVVDAGLDELSTYGVLKRVGTAGVHQLFKEMEKIGLTETITEDNYPLLRITAEGARVMRQGGDVKMLWPDLTGAPSMTRRDAKSNLREETDVAATELGFDEKLFEKLKKKRLELAQREGIPPFMIFHNNTLEFFTRLQPKTIEDGRKIRGVGEAKAQKWLPEFVDIIAAHR